MIISCDKQNVFPSRWSVRVESLTHFLAKNTRVKNTLDEMLAGSVCRANDRKATLQR